MQIHDDETSYQATLAGDPMFFIRRLKTHDNRLTDLNFGAVPDAMQAPALNHFMVLTGGWPHQTLEFDAIGYEDTPGTVLNQREAQIAELIDAALPVFKVISTQRMLVRQRIVLRLKIG